jgi:hypothetical protein
MLIKELNNIGGEIGGEKAKQRRFDVLLSPSPPLIPI